MNKETEKHKMNKINKQQFAKIFQKYPVIICYLFGSQATGKTHKNSDYDFAIFLKNSVSHNDFFDIELKIMGELTELLHNDKVEVVVMNHSKLSTHFKYNIIREGKVVFCSNNSVRIQQEFLIMKKYFDELFRIKLGAEIFLDRISKGEFKWSPNLTLKNT